MPCAKIIMLSMILCHILPHLVLQVTVKEQDKDTEWAKAIVDAYHSDEFKAYLEENNTGMWWIPEELR